MNLLSWFGGCVCVLGGCAILLGAGVVGKIIFGIFSVIYGLQAMSSGRSKCKEG